MLLEKCPHCETSHVFAQERFQDLFHPDQSEFYWVMARCQNPKCSRLILITYQAGVGYKVIYPVGSFELEQSIKISQEIRNDFKEAGLCLSAGCYQASMVMSRRVLQRCLKEQGCAQHKLVDAIDYAVKEGILRTPFHKVATEIRQYGNLGAHPDDEQLVEVDESKAKQVLDFARLIIHDFYEVPATAENLRREREKKP
jgi:hypothetical protein